jgi:Mce-associated membrane protein
VTNADDALAAAEEAEAEAAEAEAMAKAARARAKAIRLRREADTAAVESAAVDLDKPTEHAEPAEEPVAEESDAEEPVAEPTEDAAEETTEPTDEAAVAEAPVDEPKTRRRLRLSPGVWKVAAATVTILVAIALLALSGVMFVHHQHIESQQKKRAEFEAAARQGVVTLMSLDHTKAQQDVDAIVGITTGDFKKDFESQAADMVKVAQENKVVTQVTVNAVAVQKMTDNTATVLLAAMSTVSNAASNKQEPRAWRLSVDVARDGDQIKLAKVEFVP